MSLSIALFIHSLTSLLAQLESNQILPIPWIMLKESYNYYPNSTTQSRQLWEPIQQHAVIVSWWGISTKIILLKPVYFLISLESRFSRATVTCNWRHEIYRWKHRYSSGCLQLVRVMYDNLMGYIYIYIYIYIYLKRLILNFQITFKISTSRWIYLCSDKSLLKRKIEEILRSLTMCNYARLYVCIHMCVRVRLLREQTELYERESDKAKIYTGCGSKLLDNF